MPQTGSLTLPAAAGSIDKPRDFGADGRSGVGFMGPSVVPAGEVPFSPGSAHDQYSNGEQLPRLERREGLLLPSPPLRGRGEQEGVAPGSLDRIPPHCDNSYESCLSLPKG